MHIWTSRTAYDICPGLLKCKLNVRPLISRRHLHAVALPFEANQSDRQAQNAHKHQ